MMPLNVDSHTVSASFACLPSLHRYYSQGKMASDSLNKDTNESATKIREQLGAGTWQYNW
jgi:hypothetical protein